MLRRVLTPLLLLPLAVTCTGTDGPTETVTPNPQSASVLTQHNDNDRTGWNDDEKALATTNVNAQQFGRVFSVSVDGQVYAQPLVVGKLAIGDGTHNVVYVATVTNTLYAFDGDDGTIYWQKNFSAPGMRPPRNTDMTGACGGNYTDFSGNMGIVGTPVIDAQRRTIYFVARSTDGDSYVQHLHAVNVVDGSEVAGSPVQITATIAGNGDGSAGGTLTFDARRQNQRQGLTLANGVVYVTFASHCDWGPYHGWVLGYDAATLSQRTVYNATPDGYGGGMWESGMGMAADAEGSLYVITGNGTVGGSGDPANLRNRGSSAIKLVPSGTTLRVESWFTPRDFEFLNSLDLDYGSMGSLLIPGSGLFLTGGKDGKLYLLDQGDMGGYDAATNHVRQEVPFGNAASMHSQAAYFEGSGQEFVYVWSENDPLRAIPFERAGGVLRPEELQSGGYGPGGGSGAVLSVSSNGTTAGTGILWASYAFTGDAGHDVSPGILRAFDASDVTRELWNNRQNFSRDGAGTYAKFASPTIANGHVYLPTFSNQVVVYGLLGH